MPRKPYRLFQIIGVLFLIACSTGNSNSYRLGMDSRADLDTMDKAKFILQVGHRGFVKINNNDYGFELVRINTTSNVTIEMLNTGDIIELPSQISKKQHLEKDDQSVVFELSTVLRDAAIIYVHKSHHRQPEHPAKSEVDSEEMKIQIGLTILQETPIKLKIDNQALTDILLPKGTQVHWEAKESAQIDIAQPEKTILEINGAVYKTANRKTALKITAEIQDGKLIIENR